MSVGRSPQKGPVADPLGAGFPYAVAAAVATASATTLDLAAPAQIVLPVVLLAFGMQRVLAALVRRTRLRKAADEWLECASSPSPSAFAWRVEELLGPERRRIARALKAYGEEARRPWRPGAPRLDRRRLRAEAPLLAAVAAALGDERTDVSPRAVLLARRLVTDVGSPLHAAARHDELRPCLQELLTVDVDSRPPSSAASRET